MPELGSGRWIWIAGTLELGSSRSQEPAELMAPLQKHGKPSMVDGLAITEGLPLSCKALEQVCVWMMCGVSGSGVEYTVFSHVVFEA